MCYTTTRPYPSALAVQWAGVVVMSCLIWVAASDSNNLRALMIPCTNNHSLLEYETISGHNLKIKELRKIL